MRLSELRKSLCDSLRAAFVENPLLAVQADSVQLDVDLILGHQLQKNRTWILFNRDFEVGDECMQKILELAEKRKSGFPVAYITGHKEFFGLDFLVSPDVLIPKPDTELLVELAVQGVRDFILKNGRGPRICDMCSGSGCVGISFAHSIENTDGLRPFSEAEKLCSLCFCDISENALDMTRKNCERLFAAADFFEQPEFIQTNLFGALESPFREFDLIVTNPPYVPHSQSVELLKDGRSEPILALDGDVLADGRPGESDDGLALIRRLVPECYAHLTDGGLLMMETGEYNAEETSVLFTEAGFKDVRIERDMNGMLRDVIGRK